MERPTTRRGHQQDPANEALGAGEDSSLWDSVQAAPLLARLSNLGPASRTSSLRVTVSNSSKFERHNASPVAASVTARSSPLHLDVRPTTRRGAQQVTSQTQSEAKSQAARQAPSMAAMPATSSQADVLVLEHSSSQLSSATVSESLGSCVEIVFSEEEEEEEEEAPSGLKQQQQFRSKQNNVPHQQRQFSSTSTSSITFDSEAELVYSEDEHDKQLQKMGNAVQQFRQPVTGGSTCTHTTSSSSSSLIQSDLEICYSQDEVREQQHQQPKEQTAAEARCEQQELNQALAELEQLHASLVAVKQGTRSTCTSSNSSRSGTEGMSSTSGHRSSKSFAGKGSSGSRGRHEGDGEAAERLQHVGSEQAPEEKRVAGAANASQPGTGSSSGRGWGGSGAGVEGKGRDSGSSGALGGEGSVTGVSAAQEAAAATDALFSSLVAVRQGSRSSSSSRRSNRQAGEKNSRDAGGQGRISTCSSMDCTVENISGRTSLEGFNAVVTESALSAPPAAAAVGTGCLVGSLQNTDHDSLRSMSSKRERHTQSSHGRRGSRQEQVVLGPRRSSKQEEGWLLGGGKTVVDVASSNTRRHSSNRSSSRSKQSFQEGSDRGVRRHRQELDAIGNMCSERSGSARVSTAAGEGLQSRVPSVDVDELLREEQRQKTASGRSSNSKRTVKLQVGSNNEQGTQVTFDQREKLLWDGSAEPNRLSQWAQFQAAHGSQGLHTQLGLLQGGRHQAEAVQGCAAQHTARGGSSITCNAPQDGVADGVADAFLLAERGRVQGDDKDHE